MAEKKIKLTKKQGAQVSAFVSQLTEIQNRFSMYFTGIINGHDIDIGTFQGIEPDGSDVLMVVEVPDAPKAETPAKKAPKRK